MDGESLFQSTHAALTFAFNFSGQAAPPILYRLGNKESHGPSKGLGGCDGAAQAGMIRYEVERMGRINEAIIIARHAPRYYPCDCGRGCCSGRLRNMERANAVALLADQCRSSVLEGCSSEYEMRRAYVEIYFGEWISDAEVAEKHGKDRRTVSAHRKRVGDLLKELEKSTDERIDEKMHELGLVMD